MCARILIVEDESFTAEDIRLKLQDLGYDVVGVTTSGEEAMALAETLRPDLVTMDGKLSGPMDGFEAGRRIAQIVGCPVVYVSGNREARKMPVSVPKPFTREMLASALARALGSRTE
jgi:CheY-like chemotaxis protein